MLVVVGSDLRMTDFSLRQINEIGGCREQKIDEWGR
jgi:hypothetical protein